MSDVFSEVYGTYYKIVAKLLDRAVEGNLTGKELSSIISAKGYGDSPLQLLPALQDGNWKIFNADLETPIKHKPLMPLTILQKRWLKALLLDERLPLFISEKILLKEQQALQDIKPLFSPEQFIFFDRYIDGDDYKNPRYRDNFRQLLQALQKLRRISVSYRNNRNKIVKFSDIVPLSLEYSAKNDKFRLQSIAEGKRLTLNLNKIISVETGSLFSEELLTSVDIKKRQLVLEIKDERRAMERALLHFSDLAKETKRLDGNNYLLVLTYDKSDEQEMLFRVLSFGPMIKVLKPVHFVNLIRSRLQEQAKLKTI